MASVSLYLVFSSIQYMVCCNDIHLAKASLICASILVGISKSLEDRTAYWAWQVGIRALPTLGAFAWSKLGRVESRKKNYFESSYRRVGILFTPFPIRLLVRKCNISVLILLLTSFNFLGSRGFLESLRYQCGWILFLVPPITGLFIGELSSKGFLPHLLSF